MSHSMIPFREGETPPIGWMLAEIQGKGLFWVDPRTSKGTVLRPDDPSRLSFRAFKKRLGGLDPRSLNKTFKNFSTDHHPDKEIAIWERIAGVIEAELGRRPAASDAIRNLVYKAALGCANTGAPMALGPAAGRPYDYDEMIECAVGRFLSVLLDLSVLEGCLHCGEEWAS